MLLLDVHHNVLPLYTAREASYNYCWYQRIVYPYQLPYEWNSNPHKIRLNTAWEILDLDYHKDRFALPYTHVTGNDNGRWYRTVPISVLKLRQKEA